MEVYGFWVEEVKVYVDGCLCGNAESGISKIGLREQGEGDPTLSKSSSASDPLFPESSSDSAFLFPLFFCSSVPDMIVMERNERGKMVG